MHSRFIRQLTLTVPRVEQEIFWSWRRGLLHRGMMRLAQRVHGEHHFLMSVPHGEAGEPQECLLGLGSARPAGGGEARCERSS